MSNFQLYHGTEQQAATVDPSDNFDDLFFKGKN
jgi:hypothetical protein